MCLFLTTSGVCRVNSLVMTSLFALSLSSVVSTPAYADDCLLGTNDDGDADSNIDTDGNADSDGNPARLACGQNAEATGFRSIALGSEADASGDSALAAGAGSTASGIRSTAIGRDAEASGTAFSKIDNNTAAIEKSFESLQDVEQGLAAVAALPDMFLARDETFAASGGAAVFGDEFGFGGTIAIRGTERWSFGASAAFGGDEATGKVQVRWAK